MQTRLRAALERGKAKICFFFVWKRPGREISLEWGKPDTGLRVAKQLREALHEDRWERITLQEDAQGLESGIDWTVARKMLKAAAKKPLIASGLRMLWQGAIRRANHGGDLVCLKCGQPNTLRHALLDCVRWAEFDLGPDPSWSADFPNQPPCFVVRGLVPKAATTHPLLTPNQLATHCTGVFAGEFLPVSDVFYGTDASGGPRGSDPRLRVVSWAVVAIRLRPGSEGGPEHEVLGTMTGTLQIGATVNEGESVALDQLAARLRSKANVAVDSKIAIRWCQLSGSKQPRPDIWTTSDEDRELLQLSWTKGHLTKQEHTQKFGQDYVWAWFANTEADRCSGQRSEEVFSYEQAQRTDAVDRAAKGRAAWLGRRCSHILKTDPVPKRSELKFEAVPVKNRPVRKQDYNKRHAMLAATQQRDPATGHQWAVASSAKNLTIKCHDCGLYAQQTDPVDTVKFVLQHPCRGRAVAPSADSGVHPSHSIANLGRLWSCSLCNANYSVRAPAKGRLAKECLGASRASSSKRKPDSAAQTKMQGIAAPVAKTKAQGFSLLFAGRQPTQPVSSVRSGSSRALTIPNACYKVFLLTRGFPVWCPRLAVRPQRPGRFSPKPLR